MEFFRRASLLQAGNGVFGLSLSAFDRDWFWRNPFKYLHFSAGRRCLATVAANEVMNYRSY
jgi:hypothetical protein